MDLPLMPPIKPMLAKPTKQIPAGMLYEPKWDGFRAIVFRDGDEVVIGSRNERPLTRYFPELVEAFRENLPRRCVVDGEIVLPDVTGTRLDFESLQARLHPAESRVRRLAEQTPARFVAFDLLAIGDQDLCQVPMIERRQRLEQELSKAEAPVHLTIATTDTDLGRQWFEEFEGAGLDGLIAKPLRATYQPDKRAMWKVKHERTADCVVAGFRVHKAGPDAVGSLLLGLFNDDAFLVPMGVIGAFGAAVRKQLFVELQPLVTDLADHPWSWTAHSTETSRWNAGKDLSFVPLRLERVVEARYDYLEQGRFRHTAQFVRWRPDRTPESCTVAQLDHPVSFDLHEVLNSRP